MITNNKSCNLKFKSTQDVVSVVYEASVDSVDCDVISGTGISEPHYDGEVRYESADHLRMRGNT